MYKKMRATQYRNMRSFSLSSLKAPKETQKTPSLALDCFETNKMGSITSMPNTIGIFQDN
jgi:hypothetical protein